ncbi:MAG: FKBP-type peptidyl-prolyl cis-trans isomerase [Paracoccaceae bacterium]
MTSLLKTGFVAASVALAVPAAAQEVAPLETPQQKASYGIGYNMGQSISQQGLTLDEIDPAALAQAVRDFLAGDDPRVPEAELIDAFTAIQVAVQAREEAKAEKAVAAGAAFLEENKAAEGVVTTESGLQYRIETEGDGASPQATDTVSVHYEGRLLDGTVFDSSYARGEPASFGVTQVIPGWTESLLLMKPGGKFEVWIPSELAYGSRGAGADIGPNETLNFTIELLEIAEK